MTLRCRVIPRRRPFSRLGRMPRSAQSLLTLAFVATAGIALVACGGEDAKLLPGETAREITANLDSVQQLSDEGDCLGAESAAQQVGEQIEALQGVDRKLKQALEDGAARLEEVIAGCEESTTEAIAPAVIPSELEEGEKEEKPKGGKETKSKEEETAETTSPSLPPQAKGKAKGHEEESAPPVAEEGAEEEGQAETPSGGVGPGSPVGGGK